MVEDDESLRLELRRVLEEDGHWVQESTRRGAPSAIRESSPDLLVVDLGLAPAGDALETLTTMCEASIVPVIALSRDTGSAEPPTVLRVDVDDYVVMPWSPLDVAAHARSVLHRVELAAQTGPLVFDGLVIDPESREVTAGGLAVTLTAREFDVLAYLASAPRQALTREHLLRAVWGSSSDWQDPDTVTEHIRRVRRKIEVNPADPVWIRTVRGVGYMFEPAA